ncbi:hypothetical protein ACT3SP_17270 [Brachybacterium sp. AOP43-C2-M15]|uniref:hypothetical protein n=1 Tax=Brachybacterium sp. AOP43-C2-M15 TaxID=3457661 RepID=UPI0040337677
MGIAAGGFPMSGVAGAFPGGSAGIGAILGGLTGTADGIALGVGVESSLGPRLGEELGVHDDPADDIGPIESGDVSRPDDAKDPNNIDELLENLDDVGKAHEKDAATVRVQEVVGEDGRSRYIVYVPGSTGPMGNATGPDANGNPMDWNQNPGALEGRETDSSQAVIAAMKSAGVPPGADVALVGHSQGGIVANNLAADPSINGAPDGWNITNVVSAGSPVENADVPSSTTTLNLAHVPNSEEGPSSPWLADSSRFFRTPVGDIVPGLDNNPHIVEGTPPNRHEVGLPAPTNDPLKNHSVSNYRESVQGANGEAAETIRAMENDPAMRNYLGDGRVADTVDVSVGREDGTYGEPRSTPENILDPHIDGDPLDIKWGGPMMPLWQGTR